MLSPDEVNWELPWWIRICRSARPRYSKGFLFNVGRIFRVHDSLSSLQGQSCTVVALLYRGDRWLKQPGQKMEGNHVSLSKVSRRSPHNPGSRTRFKGHKGATGGTE
jgi:hypothetical protein